jgi:hypothetical protein
VYLNSLVQHKEWNQYFEKSKMYEVMSVVHMTPHEIMQRAEYKEFMEKFGKQCHVSA